MKHMPVLHERNIFLTVEVEDVPRIAGADRIEMSKLEDDAYRVILHYGFMQRPNIPVAMKLLSMLELEIDVEAVTYVVGVEDIEPIDQVMPLQRFKTSMFSYLWRNGERMSDSYNLPPERTIVIGKQVRI